MNIHQWKQQINNFNSAFENHTVVHDEWNENVELNMSRFSKKNSIWNLKGAYGGENEKAFILVGASPCLEKDVEKLKSADDNFRIICCNSSLKYLLKNGIKPHYCICLDSDKLDIPKHLDCDNEDITLLASSVVHPNALDIWNGKIWYLPYYAVDKKYHAQLRRKLGKKVAAGGNSITEAIVVATLIFGAMSVIFVGCEYCFDKDYYVDKSIAKQEKLDVFISVRDVVGRDRWSLSALHVYAIWTDKACTDLSPPCFFIDTSYGLLGKTTTAIHHMDLEEAINRTKGAFELKNKLNNAASDEEREKIIQNIQAEQNSGEVRVYNMQAQRRELLRFARSRS